MSPLPWGWLNAAPELVTPAEVKRDLAAVADTVAFHAIVAHWDDVVPCNMELDFECKRHVAWSWHCNCGDFWASCQEHRDEADADNIEWELDCNQCKSIIPDPIPWLPL